jgi:hypothetical protein
LLLRIEEVLLLIQIFLTFWSWKKRQDPDVWSRWWNVLYYSCAEQ